MNGVKFNVRWNDLDGKPHAKQYDTEPDARKARKWLEDKGITDVDVAIVMGRRETKVPDQKPAVTVPDYRQQMI